MTERIYSYAERRGWAVARPSSIALLAVLLGFGGGLWLNVLHSAEGGRESGEPGWLAHWLRDSTLALPIVLISVWASFVIVRRLIKSRDVSPLLAGMLLAVVSSVITSYAVAFMGPIHTALFHAHHGGHELPAALHQGRDALLALTVNLPLAAIGCCFLARSRPWSAPTTRMRVSSRRQAFALAGAIALFGLAPFGVFAKTGVQLAQAGGSPGQPCPTSAPVRSYNVSAIDVNITLNRYGDHDPLGKMYVLNDRIPDVRAEEQSRNVSLGLREDAIQPLVIRANMGDCVEVSFTNNAAGGDYGMHIDGMSFEAGSSGDAVGRNPSTAAARGETRIYRYYVPEEPTVEGSHYIRPGAGNRQAVSHGLFGSLSVEPKGSKWTSIETGKPIDSGWQANIAPAGEKSFREYVKIFHEVGDESYQLPDGKGGTLPRVDPHTTAYRPGTRAINYRSEPFMHRLDTNDKFKALSYNSFTYGDPVTPMPRGYLGDPTKIRILHAGSEVFHVYHLHGGGIRWRLNPAGDHTFKYSDTGLNKHPKTASSPSSRLDSQAFGPGESYNLEIEGGAGGVQQSAGDFLFHCHIAEHYVAGMWSFWRVYDTRQVDLAPLPDRSAPGEAVDSAGLIGKTMPDGTKLSKDNLDDWIRPQLPTQGVSTGEMDASTWDWKVDDSDPTKPLYLGAPEEKTAYPNLWTAADAWRVDGHPGLMPGDTPVGADDRPKILFDPVNGRPAFPLLRPQIGKRAPYSPAGHSGAPWLGNDNRSASGTGPDPWSSRPDAICPTGSPLRRFNIVSIQKAAQVTQAGAVDPNAKIFVLAKDKEDVLAGRKPFEPLAIRGNIGDCVNVVLTSEQKDTVEQPIPQTNIHIHHVQFDVQASDGVGTGMQYNQAVRPYKDEDMQMTAAANAGSQTLKFAGITTKFRPGVWIAVGEGTEGVEIRQIESVDSTAGTLTLRKALDNSHPSGEWAGTEFVQYRWYPDVVLDNIFFHDHVDGIHNWGHGLVGQYIVEPAGSTYHDPATGAQVDSGTTVDIHTPNPLAPGLVNGSFREQAIWTIDENPATDSTINLRAAPFADRLKSGADPSQLFSSYKHGDPNTPLPRAYTGDPFVFRAIDVGPNMDTFHVDGHRFFTESRYTGPDGKPEATPVDTIHYGVSEKFTLPLEGGAGGISQQPGDYLYMNGIQRRFRQGAWGILRVLPRQVNDLQPLPGTNVPTGSFQQPTQTGGAPPAASGPGTPCPANAPQRVFSVTAVDVPGGNAGAKVAYVPSKDAQAASNGTKPPEPLVLHAAAGECIDVHFTNSRGSSRASFHVSKLSRGIESSGINIGFNPEQTVAPGGSRDYRFYADTAKIGSALISDFGDSGSGVDGLYGAMAIAPEGAKFKDPVSGDPRDIGAKVAVELPSGHDYRDFTLLFAESDPVIGGSFMPYPTTISGAAVVNYQAEPRADDASMYSSTAHGDPKTPILEAYAGEPVRVHAVIGPGSEQAHVFSLGGMSWSTDPGFGHSNEVASQGFGPWETVDTQIIGGAGGRAQAAGDFWYGDLRRAFAEAGMWGLVRVVPKADCKAAAAAGDLQPLRCPPPAPEPAPSPNTGGGGGSGTGGSTPTDNSGSTPADGGTGSGGSGGSGGHSSDESTSTTTTTAPAPAPAKTGGTITPKTPANARIVKVSGLRTVRSISIASLRRAGLPIRVTVPGGTRWLELRVVRESDGRTAAKVFRVVSRNRRLNFHWLLDQRMLKRISNGDYVLRITPIVPGRGTAASERRLRIG
jgi:FtsP/CotA-like multicopper oxidase with cupredoxin domain